jgi:hypothetical protein
MFLNAGAVDPAYRLLGWAEQRAQELALIG